MTTPERAPLEAAERTVRRLGRLILGRLIGDACPPGWGFALLLSSSGEGGFSTYVSNAQRADMIALLRELADTIERGEPHV